MNLLNDDYLLSLINKLISAEDSDSEQNEWLNILEESTCPEISDYIFWSNEILTAKEILEKAKNYTIIHL